MTVQFLLMIYMVPPGDIYGSSCRLILQANLKERVFGQSVLMIKWSVELQVTLRSGVSVDGGTEGGMMCSSECHVNNVVYPYGYGYMAIYLCGYTVINPYGFTTLYIPTRVCLLLLFVSKGAPDTQIHLLRDLAKGCTCKQLLCHEPLQLDAGTWEVQSAGGASMN